MGKKDSDTISLEDVNPLLRKARGFWRLLAYVIAACMAIYHIYILAFFPLDPWIFRITHLQFPVVLGFIYYAGWSKASARIHPLDILLMLMSISTMVYVYYTFDSLVQRAGVMPDKLDLIFGSFAIITVVELTRRSVGPLLAILVLVFIAYCFVGPYLPGIFQHNGYDIERTISHIFSKSGIYNIPLGVTASFVYIFILFGAFLQLSGTANFFMDSAYVAAGRTRGGPAKVGIIASCLFGMVNGTSTGNVVTTGSMTIPLMKRVGYNGTFAGAVESCASTGGQIMPPIMGAAVFLMASIIRKPYAEIMVAAIIPALLYYIALFLMVDIEAIKKKLFALAPSEIPAVSSILKRFYLAFPIIILLYWLLIVRSSIVLAGLLGLASAFLIGILHHAINKKFIGFKEFADTLHAGATNVIQVSVTCAAAGIIMGTMSLTGLGMKIASIVVTYSYDNLLIALFLTMIISIILGMGLPTIAAYAITASVVAPALIELGIPHIPAHLFVLYYACLSAITPPVALASYAAAAIAQVNPMRLAFLGLKLGLAGFLIPFMFVYGNSLLLMGSIDQIIIATITAIIGIICLAVALQGYLWGPLNYFLRILFFATSLILIKPGLTTDLIGLSIIALGTIVQLKFFRHKHNDDLARAH